MFDSFDSGKKGSLETSEMMALLRKLMPSANAADLSFFQILVDTDGAGRVVYQDFVTRIKDIVTASQAFSERGNMDVERVLQAVKSLVRSSAGDVRASFTRAGKLAYAQVLDAFARHMSATAQDRRVFAAFVRQLDLDNSGTVSYEELAYALRTKDVVIVGGDGTTPKRQRSSAAPGNRLRVVPRAHQPKRTLVPRRSSHHARVQPRYGRRAVAAAGG